MSNFLDKGGWRCEYQENLRPPMKKNLLFFFFIVLFFSGTAQTGGDRVFEFLHLSPSARVTALGGQLLAVRDNDLALAAENPGLLYEGMNKQLSFNYNFHVADISNGYAAYGHHSKKLGMTFQGGVQFINYGDFTQTNEFNEVLGSFNAAEYAIHVGAAKQLYANLSVGASLKFITSQLESYQSTGLALDLGAYYRDTSSNFSAAIVIKNAGITLSSYTDNNREYLPFEINIGVAQKLKYLPFRLSINYRNLDQWNILYDDPNVIDQGPLLGDSEPQERSGFAIGMDNFFRHLSFGGEFLFGKRENFRMRIGYNHLRRAELKVANFRSLTGFSFGVGFKVSKFRVEYGRGSYHLAGGVNHLSISTSLNEFKNKRKQ